MSCYVVNWYSCDELAPGSYYNCQLIGTDFLGCFEDTQEEISWIDDETGGGGNYTETCDLPSGRAVAEKDRIEICGTGDGTRTKCYFWKVYVVSGGVFLPLFIFSKEQGLQTLGPDGRWRFTTFQHQDLYLDGYAILYSCSTSNVTATPSIQSVNGIARQAATMHLSFTVNISAICNSMPVVRSTSVSKPNSWHVNE